MTQTTMTRGIYVRGIVGEIAMESGVPTLRIGLSCIASTLGVEQVTVRCGHGRDTTERQITSTTEREEGKRFLLNLVAWKLQDVDEMTHVEVEVDGGTFNFRTAQIPISFDTRGA